MWNHEKFSRVDTQVSIMTAVIVIISCGLVFVLNYCFTYQDMIESLQERVLGIHTYLETRLDRETFELLNNSDDEGLPAYRDAKSLLENVRSATGVRYLYTAKMGTDGRFIYLVDGLPSGSGDFRHVGDAIEPEIIPDMQRALSGKLVLPGEIKSTSWGYIFIAYLPIHADSEVIGVVGIEFDAQHQYWTFQLLKFITPAVIVLFCVLSAMIAVALFKRISNPTYRVLANTDFLTRLKNRNAFETDLGNLNNYAPNMPIGLLSMDLDDLKGVNDSLGHAAGDAYIIEGSRRLLSLLKPDDILYRTGGDEFVAVIRGATGEGLASILSRLEELEREEAPSVEGRRVRLSAGYALYDAAQDRDLFDTLKRSDQAMYDKKRHRKNAAPCVEKQ